MQDAADRPIEQFAVVADNHHSMGIFDQISFEPERTFEVEVVGGLVKQEQVRFGKEDSREGHSHPPAAREGRAGHALFFVGKPKTLEDRTGAPLCRPGVNIGQPRLNIGNPVCVGRGFGLCHQGCAFDIGNKHGVDE